MFSHMDSNSFAEAKSKNEISLPEVSRTSVETVFNLAKNPKMGLSAGNVDNEGLVCH